MAADTDAPVSETPDSSGLASTPAASGVSEKNESRARRNFRWFRWSAAIAIIGGAALVSIDWRVNDRMSCDSTTIDRKVPSLSVTATHEQTGHCSPRTLTADDLAPLLIAAGLLLLPDVKSLKIGGLQFERLNEKVDEQTEKLTSLNQSIQSTLQNSIQAEFNVGGSSTPMAQLAGLYHDLQSMSAQAELTPDDQRVLQQIDASYYILYAAPNELQAMATVKQMSDLARTLVARGMKTAAFPSKDQPLTVEELEAEIPRSDAGDTG